MKRILSFFKRLYFRFRPSSIQSVITLSFTGVMLLAMLIVSVSLYHLFSDSAEQNAALSTQQIVDQVGRNLNSYIEGMMEISDIIRSSLKSDTYQKDDLPYILNVTKKIRKDIVTVVVYSQRGNVIASNPRGVYNKNYEVTQQDWFITLMNNPVDYIFLSPHVQRIFEDSHPWVVSLCRAATYYENEKPVIFFTVVDMNFRTIEQMCNNVSLGKRGYIYIIDRSGNMVYHPQQQMIYAGLKTENTMDALTREPGTYFEDFNGERRVMTIKNVSYSGWKIVGISYVDELVTNKKYFNRFIIFISLFGIVFEILASMFISYKISQPIKRLEREMKKLEKGDFNISVEEKGEDEVRQLSRAFNMMVAKIKMLMDQIITEQEEKRKSELKALQAQINPHFLYNTLDSIIWMNENQNYEGVTVMVAALAKLFRISLSRGHEIICIADEVEHARNYLTIQKIRYKDKFDYTIEMEPGLESERTLKLILQPIIENAIYHGISPLNEKGIIKISVKSEGKNILFQVSDNGYGIEPEILKELLNQESKSYHSGGVGLKNVNERIKLFHGEEYGIEIISEIDVGTTVNIRIPR